MGNNPANREKVGGENQLLVGFENVFPITIRNRQHYVMPTQFFRCSFIIQSSLKQLNHLSTHPTISASGGILAHLKELLETMRRRKRLESVSTSKLMKFVQAESAIFERERHQDCHQFYIWLMNSINDQLKGKEKSKSTPLEVEFFSKRVTRTECSVCKAGIDQVIRQYPSVKRKKQI